MDEDATHEQRIKKGIARVAARQPRGLAVRDLTRFLESSYGLSPQEPPHSLPSAVDTTVWRVTASDQEYILKAFLSGDADAVHTEVKLLDYVRAAGIRAPDVISDLNGRRVGVIVERRLPLLRARRIPAMVMRLEDMRRVRPRSVTRAQMLSIARRIGAMHEALRRYPQRAEIRRAERWRAQLGSFDDFVRSPNAEWFDRDEITMLRALDRRMEQQVDGTEPGGLTESVLHGDLGLHHVGIARARRADGEPYFFDFSDYCHGPVVLDLATLLSHSYGQSDIDFDRWEKLRAWLLEGYESVLKLSNSDHAAIETVLLERLLIEIRYFNRISLSTTVAYDPVGVRKRYRLAGYLLHELSCALAPQVPKSADHAAAPVIGHAGFLAAGE